MRSTTREARGSPRSPACRGISAWRTRPSLASALARSSSPAASEGENILGRPVEFGWHEVRPTTAGADDPVLSAIGAGAPIFHWHEDTFTLPPDSVHLAESAMTENQAFRIGRAVYGVQFHFEADRRLVGDWTAEFAEMIAGYRADWPSAHPVEAARHGEKADAAGLALARAWVGLI